MVLKGIESNKNGFSLLEVSIVMIVIGLMLVPLMYFYNQYILARKLTDTKSAELTVATALVRYVAKYGHYPIPAEPSVAQGNVGFGVQATLPVTGWPACTVTSTVVCRTTTNVFGGRAVLIGSVPFAAIGIPFTASVDGYGMRLTYAVTEELTATATYNDSNGSIEILDDTGNSIYAPGSSRSHFVIVSHGDDHRGAFSLAGVKVSACGANLDSDNCNNDGQFRNNYNTVLGRPALNYAAGVNHFDDLINSNNTASSGLWSMIPSTPSMKASNAGNVYIGVCPTTPCIPKSHLEVEGNVRANIVKTGRLCNRNGGACYDPTVLGALYQPGYSPPGIPSPEFIVGGPTGLPDNQNYPAPLSTLYTWNTSTESHNGAGISCVGSRGLRGTSSYTEYCNYTTYFTPSVNIGTCNAGEYAYGFDFSTGTLLCKLP